jgi:hypothetical protein
MMRLIRWMIAGVVVAGLAVGCSRGPEVSVDPARVRLGEPITVSFEDAPVNRRAWIGLYQAGESDTHRYLTYLYAGDGAVAGQVTFDRSIYRNRLTPGEYEAKLLLGYEDLASARFRIIDADGRPLLSLTKSRIEAGEPIEIHWTSAPERAWIDIYKVDDRAPVVIEYPGIATDGEVTFNADDFKVALQPGNYRVRLMSKDHVAELASAPFRVLDPNAGPRVTLAKAKFRSGEPLEVSWRQSPGNERDWIGIYEADVDDTHRYLMWLYTKGDINGAVTFDRPLPPGQYVAKLLVDNGYEEVGVSEPFTVRAQ